MTVADPLRPPQSGLDAYRADPSFRCFQIRLPQVTLAAQLAGGMVFHSIALTAAGLHMAAHLMAMLVAAAAYALARRHAGSARFTFGTGKLGDLAGFANAVVDPASARGPHFRRRTVGTGE